MALKDLKIAIVCDWLTNFGGAERVIFSLHRLFPDAPIYTSLFNETSMKPFCDTKIYISSFQKLPFFKRYHQFFIHFMPHIFENFDLSAYDIVISSCHSCSKGIITKPRTLHICYCHSPTRYLWDHWQEYIHQYRLPKLVERCFMKSMHRLRIWDRFAADRVDAYVANSRFVADRIHKFYRKKSHVIHPPLEIERFSPSKNIGDFFLAAGRLVPYKRFDLLVEVFNNNGFKLKICGDGYQYGALKREAKDTIEFLGNVSDDTLKDLMSQCRAFLFPQCEDFGIAPLEAMASGRPVIAYRAGGALETVIDEKTGIFFDAQTPESFNDALQRFEKMSFDPKAIRRHAEGFSEKRFQKEFMSFIEERWADWSKKD
ncbi:glycosyltransferase [Candidatus Peregrinibacteria bacterium]|nr:glycosyltransferase [Candidatus Peregrinibacteria bacterium]